jgi:hypothetical protein
VQKTLKISPDDAPKSTDSIVLSAVAGSARGRGFLDKIGGVCTGFNGVLAQNPQNGSRMQMVKNFVGGFIVVF